MVCRHSRHTRAIALHCVCVSGEKSDERTSPGRSDSSVTIPRKQYICVTALEKEKEHKGFLKNSRVFYCVRTGLPPCTPVPLCPRGHPHARGARSGNCSETRQLHAHLAPAPLQRRPIPLCALHALHARAHTEPSPASRCSLPRLCSSTHLSSRVESLGATLRAASSLTDEPRHAGTCAAQRATCTGTA